MILFLQADVSLPSTIDLIFLSDCHKLYETHLFEVSYDYTFVKRIGIKRKNWWLVITLKVKMLFLSRVILSILSRYRYLTATEREREGCSKWTWIVTQLSLSRWVTVTGQNRKYYCNLMCFLWKYSFGKNLANQVVLWPIVLWPIWFYHIQN